MASMDPEKARIIRSEGGKAAHRQGTAHEWTAGAEAQAAGRKGGLASAEAKRLKKQLAAALDGTT